VSEPQTTARRERTPSDESDVTGTPAGAVEGAERGLEARGLVKQFRGRRVVDDVSIRILPGEVIGLLGPNGAGKTTSFHLILGLVPPKRGRVLLDGRDITSLPMYLRARRGVGYLPQEASVFRRMTVEENLLSILEMRSLTPEQARERAAELIHEFGLVTVARTPGYALSGGERRRAEIARALAPLLITAAIAWLTLEGSAVVVVFGLAASVILYFTVDTTASDAARHAAPYAGSECRSGGRTRGRPRCFCGNCDALL